MDQPYSRIADALLDKQYWAPDDPQKHPYDDTGWSFSELFNLKVARLTDPSILTAKMTIVEDPASLSGKQTGTGSIAVVANTGQSSLLALVYKLKDAKVAVAEKAFDVGGSHYAAGSLLISDVSDATLAPMLKELSLDASRLAAAPDVPTHTVKAPRIAFMHTWQGTQTEGWWRYEFDHVGVPYKYISTQTAAADADLRSKYDVIIFAPVGYASTESIINGTPRYGNATPWQTTDLTPNLGRNDDSTPDTRPGLGYDGLEHLRKFVEQGGLLITSEDTAQFAIDTGLAPGVSVVHSDARVTGTILDTVFVAPQHPVAYGYSQSVPVISANGMAFNVSNTEGGRGSFRTLMDPYSQRPTGRGSVEDSDVVEGRKNVDPEPLTKQKPWEAKTLNEEQLRDNPSVIPVALRPDVILRFADAKGMLLSGLLANEGSIAERAIVVDAHLGEGNVLLFANNPVYRGETVGSYPLVFNAILNFDHLGHATKP
jgi:hypothetical protein